VFTPFGSIAHYLADESLPCLLLSALLAHHLPCTFLTALLTLLHTLARLHPPGFDYRGEPSLINSDAGQWPAVSSSWGIHDLVGFRKDMFYAYQSWLTSVGSSPMVHLVPHTW
jgi:hypothetical protein